MSIVKSLLKEAVSPAQKFVQQNKNVLERIVPTQKVVQKAEEFKKNFFQKEFTEASTLEELAEFIWDGLADWHSQYEDEYYEKITGEMGLDFYDEVMGERQENAIEQVIDEEEFNDERRGVGSNKEYKKDLEYQWKSSRGV